MILDDSMSKVIAELEYCIGSECYNPNSYDGWNDIEGCDFRYPIIVPVIETDGEVHFQKVKRKLTETILVDEKDITPRSMLHMKYRFGSNELFIGRGIKNVLEFMEERYGLDFNKLEEQYQEKQG